MELVRERDFEEPFTVSQFLEDLTSQVLRAADSKKQDEDGIDTRSLLEAFERSIDTLQGMSEKTARRVEKLSKVCQEEERKYYSSVSQVERAVSQAYHHFQELDERINGVATKVVHLGDQLEGLNSSRSRAENARQIMQYFLEFFQSEEPSSIIFVDPSQLHKGAEVIQKLNFLCQDLPEKFLDVKMRIARKYVEIERALLQEFEASHVAGRISRMKMCADALAQYKDYSKCVGKFIDHCQRGAFQSGDLFEEIYKLTGQVCDLVKSVFTSPESVTDLFIQDMFERRLQQHVTEQLSASRNQEAYLGTLFTLYTKTQKTASRLEEFRHSSDSAFLTRLTQSVFLPHLSTYMKKEEKFLQEKYSQLLVGYYDSVGLHRPKGSGGFRLKKGEGGASRTGETFISDDVATMMLHENKLALKRCTSLSSAADLCANASVIFDVLLDFLCFRHLDNAVDLALAALPSPEPKNVPVISLFPVISQLSKTVHLLDKHFVDNVVPLISSSPAHAECLHKKKEVSAQLEKKMDSGLDQALTSLVGWVKHILSSEQKKSDFKPEETASLPALATTACHRACEFIDAQRQIVSGCLDGKNCMATLTELGIRFHRVVVDHIQQFTFNSVGGMIAICDVNDYRRVVKKFEIQFLNHLFEVLHSLCNLFIVAPHNLKQVCSEEPIAFLEKSVVLSFIQLRVDYKSSRLSKYFAIS